jgi:hypothetical protein
MISHTGNVWQRFRMTLNIIERHSRYWQHSDDDDDDGDDDDDYDN